MVQIEAVTCYPWAEESAIVGNRAIIRLRQDLPALFETANTAQTLLYATGALAGFAAQNAVWKDRAAAGLGPLEGTPPDSAFVCFGSKGGRKLYFGDHLNAHIVQQPNYDKPLPIWTLIAGAAVGAGLPAADLPPLNDMFSHVTKTAFTPDFGVPRVPEKHRPGMALIEVLAKGWPLARDILRAPPILEGNRVPEIPAEFLARSREEFAKALTQKPATEIAGEIAAQIGKPPEIALHDRHWPIVLSVVAAGFMTLAGKVIDPRTAVILVMEGAIAGSKMDPAMVARCRQPESVASV